MTLLSSNDPDFVIWRRWESIWSPFLKLSQNLRILHRLGCERKNGYVRLCIDYRKLNSKTIKDAYALSNVEEAFSAPTGSKWFSVVDLKSGYYQIEMAEEVEHKTAFVCPLGFWEFNKMPQGITNTPSTFQRIMENAWRIWIRRKCSYEARLLTVLERLRENGLKLSPEKCPPATLCLGMVLRQTRKRSMHWRPGPGLRP